MGSGGLQSARPQTIGAPLTTAKSVNDLDQLIGQFNGGGQTSMVPPPMASAAPGIAHYYSHQPQQPQQQPRPAPDYETAVRNKGIYGNGTARPQGNG